MTTYAALDERSERIAAMLAGRGLVIRRPDPDDRRGVLVTLTDDGRNRVDAALADLLAQERTILDTLPSADRTRLADLLRTVTAPFEPA